MEAFGEEHLLVVNWDGFKHRAELKKQKSRSNAKSSEGANGTDKTQNRLLGDGPTSAKSLDSRDTQLILFDKAGMYQWDFRQRSKTEQDTLLNSLQVTSVVVTRLPIGPQDNPELANLQVLHLLSELESFNSILTMLTYLLVYFQVLVGYATENPAYMLKAYDTLGNPLVHEHLQFNYDLSYGILRNLAYEQGHLAMLFDNHLVIYDCENMLK